jgi:hypothetical protein
MYWVVAASILGGMRMGRFTIWDEGGTVRVGEWWDEEGTVTVEEWWDEEGTVRVEEWWDEEGTVRVEEFTGSSRSRDGRSSPACAPLAK